MIQGLLRQALLATLFITSSAVIAGELEVDLNGFRLQQMLTVAEASLGAPFQTIDEGNQVHNAYRIDQDAYMVITHSKVHPHNIGVLQLTGATKNALPFMTLSLGDSKEKVIRVLGTPSQVINVESPKVSRYAYLGRNYSVELDESDRLYSIRIVTTNDLMEKTDNRGSEWVDFKTSILAKDFPAIAEMLRPDVEIYRGGEALSIATRFSEFVKNPDERFVSALLGDRSSVIKAIDEYEPVQEMRLITNFGIGTVYKFPKSKILKEISFFPFNGKNRVYEIAFRETAN